MSFLLPEEPVEEEEEIEEESENKRKLREIATTLFNLDKEKLGVDIDFETVFISVSHPDNEHEDQKMEEK